MTKRRADQIEGFPPTPLPPSFTATRESLRALACYVVAPARKARTGRIGLRPTDDGFGTPRFADGSQLVVRGDRLVWEPGDAITVTTLRAAAIFAGVDLSPDPGVGHDLPPYDPDADLGIERDASFSIGAWYRFGQTVLDSLSATLPPGSVTDAQLWPEHFDLALVVDLPGGARVNVGFSPGDGFHDGPYAYVGPQDSPGLSGGYWNAPFGAYLGYTDLESAADPHAVAAEFITVGLAALASAGARRG